MGAGFRRRLSGVVDLDYRIIESRSVDRKSSMTIHVRFFASLRERLDVADQELGAFAASTVAEVWQRVLGDVEPPANMLIAVNMEYADIDAPVRDGDEVAFFPPVTGG
jgi:molybdopterin synthase sulfur carrier subunit